MSEYKMMQPQQKKHLMVSQKGKHEFPRNPITVFLYIPKRIENIFKQVHKCL